jgi:hypothetical protein
MAPTKITQATFSTRITSFWALEKRRLNSAREEQQQLQQEEIHFQIIEIENNMRLAVSPLNETEDKYLCIYVESSAPNQEIISKLRNAII